jgi:hypothetical protein
MVSELHALASASILVGSLRVGLSEKLYSLFIAISCEIKK